MGSRRFPHQSRSVGPPPRAAYQAARASEGGPDLSAVSFGDPRTHNSGKIAVLAFYYPDREEACDEVCKAGFLGNFYDLGHQELELDAPNTGAQKCRFRNAEAAFQALKFWDHAADFRSISGTEAFRLKQAHASQAKLDYAGYGSNWKAMLAVLRAKFRPQSELAQALVRTGDAYLLEHCPKPDRDQLWSNNQDGSGMNWLGLQLMLVRDELGHTHAWTDWINKLVDPSCGMSPDKGKSAEWQNSVKGATWALQEELQKRRAAPVGRSVRERSMGPHSRHSPGQDYPQSQDARAPREQHRLAAGLPPARPRSPQVPNTTWETTSQAMNHWIGTRTDPTGPARRMSQSHRSKGVPNQPGSGTLPPARYQ